MATVPADLPVVNAETTQQVTTTNVQPNFNQIETNLETLRSALSDVNTELGAVGFQPKIDELVLSGSINAINSVGTLFSGGTFDASVILRDVPSNSLLRIRGQSIIPSGSIEVLQGSVAAVEGLNNTTIPFNSSIDNSTEGNTYDLFFEVLMGTTPITTETFRMVFSNTPDLGTVCYFGVADTTDAGALDLTTFDSLHKFNGLFGIRSFSSPTYLWILYPAAQDHPSELDIGGIETGGTDQLEHFFRQFNVRTIGGVQYSATRSQRRLTVAGDLAGRMFNIRRRIF